MRLGMVITQTDAETVFNALRLALYSLEQGDEVHIFLSGKGVEIDRVEDPCVQQEVREGEGPQDLLPGADQGVSRRHRDTSL